MQMPSPRGVEMVFVKQLMSGSAGILGQQSVPESFSCPGSLLPLTRKLTGLKRH